MCGINGLFKYTTITNEDLSKLNAMNKEMRYRGPDDSGIWNDNKAALSMVRLSIISVENGHQPIFNEDKNLVIICNGEIYNYRELREQLKSKGHIFTTDSDIEVIIHLYEEKGVNCLEDLRGMFAFAIWDKKSRKMFIARDRIGKKPLYYMQTPDGIIFSSELKAIQKNFLTETNLDYSVLRHILRYSYPQELKNTHIREIKRIKPGEYALIYDFGMEKHFYWQRKNSYNFDGNFEEAKERTLDLLRESVNLRLRSDVPIAVLLSGGIDSSAISALARETNDNIHAITVGYEGNFACDEREIAKKFAKEKGLIWHQLELNTNDYKRYIDEYVSYLDEPVCDVAAIAQWGLYKKIKEEGFTVLLSGNGGDELFYGYNMHNKTGNNIEFINQLKTVLSDKKSFYKWPIFTIKNLNKILELIITYKAPYFDRYFINDYKNFNYNWPDKKDNIREFCEEAYFKAEKYGIDGVYSYLSEVWLQANCFFLSDKLGMGNSLEIRAPFADHKLIEFVLTLPLEYRYKSNNPKWFLKEILRGIVPDYILYAKKRGFTPPVSFINEIINSYESKFFKTKLLNYNQILVDKFLSN